MGFPQRTGKARRLPPGILYCYRLLNCSKWTGLYSVRSSFLFVSGRQPGKGLESRITCWLRTFPHLHFEWQGLPLAHMRRSFMGYTQSIQRRMTDQNTPYSYQPSHGPGQSDCSSVGKRKIMNDRQLPFRWAETYYGTHPCIWYQSGPTFSPWGKFVVRL